MRWSDGSTSLLLGEVFDVHKNKIDGNFNHLFVQQVCDLKCFYRCSLICPLLKISIKMLVALFSCITFKSQLSPFESNNDIEGFLINPKSSNPLNILITESMLAMLLQRECSLLVVFLHLLPIKMHDRAKQADL